MCVLPKPGGTCPACQCAISLAAPAPITKEESDAAPVVSKVEHVASIVRRLQAEEAAHRLPAGLVLLALIQFGFAALAGIRFVHKFGTVVEPTEPQAEVGWAVANLIVRALLALGLLIFSGIGYLARSRIYGYWGGNILAVGWIGAVVINFARHGFAFITYFDLGVLYPLLLLLVLNLHYRTRFE
jgi:hypothetical protein